jgi:2-polyprenyl-6-methoxyphenol hydroxylase-like FAD-dependent oxidoreductase
VGDATVHIAGAGIAGLSAAIAVAHRGGRARVFERRGDAGSRFHGDFQGLEHWSTEEDVLEELSAYGIELTFEPTPFRECVFFDPERREHVCRSAQPLWYYGPRWWTPLVHPLARADAVRRRRDQAPQPWRTSCDCTYCRCASESPRHRRLDAALASPSNPSDSGRFPTL